MEADLRQGKEITQPSTLNPEAVLSSLAERWNVPIGNIWTHYATLRLDIPERENIG